jgi:hypothetical protein
MHAVALAVPLGGAACDGAAAEIAAIRLFCGVLSAPHLGKEVLEAVEMHHTGPHCFSVRIRTSPTTSPAGTTLTFIGGSWLNGATPKQSQSFYSPWFGIDTTDNRALRRD